MTPWILGSIYVAVAVLIVVTDGLWGWHEELSGDDGAVVTAAFWPLFASVLVALSPVLALAAVHEKLRSERPTP